MCVPGVTHSIEDRGERADGDNDSEQDGAGAERLAASDVEGGSSECGDAARQGLPHEWVVLRFTRRKPGRGSFSEVDHTDSVDAQPLWQKWLTRDISVCC